MKNYNKQVDTLPVTFIPSNTLKYRFISLFFVFIFAYYYMPCMCIMYHVITCSFFNRNILKCKKFHSVMKNGF